MSTEFEDYLKSLEVSDDRRYDFTLTDADGQEIETSYMAGSWQEALAWLAGEALPAFGEIKEIRAQAAPDRYYRDRDGKPVALIGIDIDKYVKD